MMRHCLLTGNAYAVIEWNNKGEPVSLTPYQPSAVNIFRKVTGEHIYQVTDLNGVTKTIFKMKSYTYAIVPLMDLWGVHL